MAARAITQGPKHHFFGYYGICPWDATGRYHLCLQSDFHDRPPGDGDTAVVGLVDMETGKFEGVAETQAWNLQQGSMLHWLATAPDRLITYNARADDRFVAVVQDIHTGQQRILPHPIAAITRNGRKALGLNYARLKSMRPVVGYAGLPDPYADQNHPTEDGLYIMDTDTGESRVTGLLRRGTRLSSATMKSCKRAKSGSTIPFINRNDTRVSFVVRVFDPDKGDRSDDNAFRQHAGRRAASHDRPRRVALRLADRGVDLRLGDDEGGAKLLPDERHDLRI